MSCTYTYQGSHLPGNQTDQPGCYNACPYHQFSIPVYIYQLNNTDVYKKINIMQAQRELLQISLAYFLNQHWDILLAGLAIVYINKQ